MITSIYCKNVRKHLDVAISVARDDVRIVGPNGVGKSTLGDALAFAFVGRDKNGAQAPVHLITEGEDKMEVAVETSRAVISRTLTRKKSSTLKLTPKVSGIPITMNQTEFNEKLGCSPDTFLSAAFAGYFFTLDAEKRMEVLRAVAPAVDRGQVLRQILAENCPDIDLAPCEQFLSPTKRSDIEAQKVAEARRGVEREQDHLRGRYAEVSGILQNRSNMPVVDEEAFRAAETRHSLWKQYRDRLSDFESASSSQAFMKSVLAAWEEKQRSLEQQQAAIPPEKADTTDEVLRLGQVVADLKKKVQPFPSKPQALSLPDGDRCMTCGQVIGSKHREKVAAEAAKIEAEWAKACDEVRVANDAVMAEVREAENVLAAAKESRKELLEHNKAVDKAWRDIRAALAEHLRQRPTLKVDPKAPEKPLVPEISEEEFKNELTRYSEATLALRQWKERERQLAEAEKKATEIAERMLVLDRAHAALAWIEQAYKQLDQRVFALNAQFYELGEGYRIEATEKSVTVVDSVGKPYEWMSTGEQIRASVRLCEKIGQSLKPRVPFLFVDNADLMDRRPECPGSQLFRVYVKNERGLIVSGESV